MKVQSKKLNNLNNVINKSLNKCWFFIKKINYLTFNMNVNLYCNYY